LAADGFQNKEIARRTGIDRGTVGVMVPALTACGHVEAGMVLPVETTMLHPRRGFIKLENTVVVTTDDCEMFGERGRGWNRGGRQTFELWSHWE
jgi:Xaa-Pro aminopeptidase